MFDENIISKSESQKYIMYNNRPFEQELKHLEKLLLKPKIRKSVSELSKILSDEFIEFGSSRNIYDKKDIIKLVQNEVAPKITLTNFKIIQLRKEHFLVTYKSLKEEKGNKTYSLRSSIWKKEKAKYQILFHQGTLINS